MFIGIFRMTHAKLSLTLIVLSYHLIDAKYWTGEAARANLLTGARLGVSRKL